VVITLGTLAAAPVAERIMVLIGISLLLTAGVYGLVAGIVKLDDLGLHLQGSRSKWRRRIGDGLLRAAHSLGGLWEGPLKIAAGMGLGLVTGAVLPAAGTLLQRLRR
jgi:uncharacterized protein